jgi:hypothetical protein
MLMRVTNLTDGGCTTKTDGNFSEGNTFGTEGADDTGKAKSLLYHPPYRDIPLHM